MTEKAAEVISDTLKRKLSSKGDFLEDAHTLSQPIGFRIVALLLEKTMHINAISKELGVERRLVSYHLNALEEHGFVSSKYEISEEQKSKGKSIRKYWVTEKAVEMISDIKEPEVAVERELEKASGEYQENERATGMISSIKEILKRFFTLNKKH